MQTPPAGSGTRASRRASSVATVSPPPAESPAITMRSGAMAWSSSQRYAAVASSTAAGIGVLGRQAVVEQERAGPGGARDGGGQVTVRARGADDVAAAVQIEHHAARLGAKAAAATRRARPGRSRAPP